MIVIIKAANKTKLKNIIKKN